MNCFTLLELKPKMIYQRYHRRLEAIVLKSKVATDVSLAIMRTFVRLKNQSVPYFDIIKRLEKLETNDKDTRELLQKVVQVVSSIQNIQDEAKEGTKKIGFL